MGALFEYLITSPFNSLIMQTLLQSQTAVQRLPCSAVRLSAWRPFGVGL